MSKILIRRSGVVFILLLILGFSYSLSAQTPDHPTITPTPIPTLTQTLTSAPTPTGNPTITPPDRTEFWVGSGGGTGDGTEEHPYGSITYALSQVEGTAEAPVILHVKLGNYEMDETYPIKMKSYVSIIGAGAKVNGSNIRNRKGDSCTILIDGSLAHDLTISDFIISGGTGFKEENGSYGGRIYIRNNAYNITIENCEIRYSGISMYERSKSDKPSQMPDEVDTTIDYGGGIASVDANGIKISKCYIHGNTAAVGGGIYCYNSPIEIIDSTITYNDALRNHLIGSGGGGIAIGKSDHALIKNCIIKENYSSSGSSGIDCWDTTLTLLDSELTYNYRSALDYSGSDNDLSVLNCKIQNSSYCGICINNFRSVQIENNGFGGNVYAIYNYQSPSSPESKCIKAENNWWGDERGPKTPDGNNCGCELVIETNGDAVSEWVDFCQDNATPTPTPSSWDSKPFLNDNSVEPDWGVWATQSTRGVWYTAHEYLVHYKDTDGGEPKTTGVYINGQFYEMSLKAGTYSDGTYHYTISSNHLQQAENNYYFYFVDDENNAVRLPQEGAFNAPMIKPAPSVTVKPTPTPMLTGS